MPNQYTRKKALENQEIVDEFDIYSSISSIDEMIDIAFDGLLVSDEFDSSDAALELTDLTNPKNYDNNTLPVDVIEFIESSEFLNLKYNNRTQTGIYPEIQQLILDICQDNIREAYLGLGKGSGKSIIGEVVPLYYAYKFGKLKKPAQSLGLMHNTQLFFTNVSVGRAQAKDIIFSGISSLIKNSPYFKDKFYITGQLISLPKRVYIYAGHSNHTAFLGYPTIVGTMDECNYMIDSANRSVAEQLQTALRGSLKTRFNKVYKLLMLSSDAGPNSFMRENIKIIADEGTAIEYEPKDKYVFTEEDKLKFFSFQDKGLLDKLINTKIQKFVSEDTYAAIAPTWLVNPRLTLMDFLKVFSNPKTKQGGLRDFACMPNVGMRPFFTDPDILDFYAEKGVRFPLVINPKGEYEPAEWFYPLPGVKYFIACDLSIKRDATGVAMVHKSIAHDSYIVDFTIQIKGSPDNPIDYEKIRNLIRSLKLKKFNIVKVGFDQHQSHDSAQILEKEGYEVEIVSYHNSVSGAGFVYDLIHTNKLVYSINDDVFIGECKELQLVNDNKVDHLTSGGHYNSKDVFDAVVNAVVLASAEKKTHKAEILFAT